MNNLLDYSHMIKTYVMITNYNENHNDNHYNNCKCDHFIFCYNDQITKCKHYNIIIDNLPLFKIILNKNIKKQFKLPKKWNNSNITSNDLFKIIYYIINFLDEINDNNYDNNHNYDINIKCIVSLSFYILIINNYNLIKNFKYLFKPLLLTSLNKLHFYLSDNISFDKFNAFFNDYFIEKPDECINIMKKWVNMLDELI